MINNKLHKNETSKKSDAKLQPQDKNENQMNHNKPIQNKHRSNLSNKHSTLKTSDRTEASNLNSADKNNVVGNDNTNSRKKLKRY